VAAVSLPESVYIDLQKIAAFGTIGARIEHHSRDLHTDGSSRNLRRRFLLPQHPVRGEAPMKPPQRLPLPICREFMGLPNDTLDINLITAGQVLTDPV